MAKDYYAILGVDKNASPDEIKKAFHKAAHKHHPDKNGGDDTKFKEANEAYQVLSDKDKRARYDQFGNADAGGFGGGYGGGFDPNGFGFDFSQGFGGQQGFDMGDLGDIFGEFFGGSRTSRGGQRKGRDYEISVVVSFKDALFGTDKTISISHNVMCDSCDGTGDKHKKPRVTCRTCNGKGSTYGVKQTFLGNIQTSMPCTTCGGVGTVPETVCSVCRGAGVVSKKETLTITIPAGIEDGATLKATGKGDAILAGKSGDLYVLIHVEKDKVFTRYNQDLFATIHVPLPDAMLGGTHTLHTHDGDITIKIPEGLQHGEKLRVKDKGVPINKNSRGDLYVTVLVDIPKKLTKQQRQLVEQLRETLD
jgi:molecular chaperone DnaJ